MTENIYHRFLNLPFDYPKPEIFNNPHNSIIKYMGHEEIYPPFQQWLNEYGVYISHIIEGFYTAPGECIDVHTDGLFEPGVKDVCKINFTWGPASSTTRWWKLKPGKKYIKMDFNDEYPINTELNELGVELADEVQGGYTAKPEDLDLAFETVIDKPSLLNVGQLHSTYNPHPSEIRWTLSFALNKGNEKDILTWEEAMDIFDRCLIK